MTMEKLHKIIIDNKIPMDVHFMSDSGWECGATDMDGVYYNKWENLIVFTQKGENFKYNLSPDWIPLTDIEDSKVRRKALFDSFDKATKGFFIPNANQDIRNRCFEKAHELYGGQLPSIVKKRMDDEFEMILGYQLVQHYMLYKKVADFCHKIGEPFWVRGNAGASFIAFLLGITKVNPLPPHFRCPKCGHTEFKYWTIFDKEEPGFKSALKSGFDLVSSYQCKVNCPKCGEKCVGDGNDISINSYMDKFEDEIKHIEFTVPAGVQSKIYSYLDELFGMDKVFFIGDVEYAEDDVKQKWYHTDKVMILPPDKCIDDYSELDLLPDINGVMPERKSTIIPPNVMEAEDLLFCVRESEMLSKLKKLELEIGVPLDSISVDGVPYHMITEDDFYKDIPLLCDALDGHKENVLTSFYDLVTVLGLSRNGLWEINSRRVLDCGLGREWLMANREDVRDVLYNYWSRTNNVNYIMNMVGIGQGTTALESYDENIHEDEIPKNVLEAMKEIKYLFPRAHDIELALVIFKFIWYKLNYPELSRIMK